MDYLESSGNEGENVISASSDGQNASVNSQPAPGFSPGIQFPDFSVPPPPIAVPYNRFQRPPSHPQQVTRFPRFSHHELTPKQHERRETDTNYYYDKIRSTDNSGRYNRYTDRSRSRSYSSQDCYSRSSKDKDQVHRKFRERNRNIQRDRNDKNDKYSSRDRKSHRSRSPLERNHDKPTTSRECSEQKHSEEVLNSERDMLLKKWRSNYCETTEDIAEKLDQLSNVEEKDCWIRSSPADLYYKRDVTTNEMVATSRLDSLSKCFDTLVNRGERARATQPSIDRPQPKRRHRVCMHKCNVLQKN